MSAYPRDPAYTEAAGKLLASRGAYFAAIRGARTSEEIDAIRAKEGRQYDADLLAVRAEEDRILEGQKVRRRRGGVS